MSGRAPTGPSILVLKFGGTALATPERVRLAARRVRAQERSGRSPVVVASAMGRKTDRILERIRKVAPGAGAGARPREADRALATGEEEAAALLALALAEVGLRTVSLRGGEAGLRAEGPHGDGTLVDVDTTVVRGHLADGVVPVVCGFQASRPDGETVTLGRNSSDLSAVALAAALDAECHLVTDVEGVFRRDPHAEDAGGSGDTGPSGGTEAAREAAVPGPSGGTSGSGRPAGAGEPGPAPASGAEGPLPRLSHDELVELAEAGAEVVHPRAARLAREHRVSLSVYSFRRSWIGGGGTRVGPGAAAGACGEVAG